MKTKISLSILGIYNTLIGLAMFFFATDAVGALINSDNSEVVRMGELMHYGLSPALLVIGLMLLLARNTSIETAKNLLLGYIIGTTLLMYIFFGIMANESLINFSVASVIPDITMLVIAIFGYVKAK
jgi:hypothetical protein